MPPTRHMNRDSRADDAAELEAKADLLKAARARWGPGVSVEVAILEAQPYVYVQEGRTGLTRIGGMYYSRLTGYRMLLKTLQAEGQAEVRE